MHMFFLNNPGNPFIYLSLSTYPTGANQGLKTTGLQAWFMLQSLLMASANANSNTGVEQSLMHVVFGIINVEECAQLQKWVSASSKTLICK